MRYHEYKLEYTLIDENGNNVLKSKDVLASDQTISDLKNNTYDYYEFIVDDGRRFLLASFYIASLLEKFGGKLVDM